MIVNVAFFFRAWWVVAMRERDHDGWGVQVRFVVGQAR